MNLVVGISGSPRIDGNTDTAVRAALADVEKAGFSTKFIRPYDLRIESCLGCRDCMREGRCTIQDDDAEEVFETLRRCSGLVLAAPVYWNGPPGRMKDLIDRSHGYYASEPGSLFRGLPYVLMSVATASGFEPHESIMTCWLDYYGARLVCKKRIYAREKGDLLKRPREMEKAKDAAKQLLQRIGSG